MGLRLLRIVNEISTRHPQTNLISINFLLAVISIIRGPRLNPVRVSYLRPVSQRIVKLLAGRIVVVLNIAVGLAPFAHMVGILYELYFEFIILLP